MAALAVGETVVTAASVLGPTAKDVAHRAAPQFGTAEALTAGPPPTAVTIAWANGTLTAYAAVHDSTTSVLYRVNTPVQPLLTNYVVQPTVASGIPNPGGQVRGPVVAQYLLEDPSGNIVREVVVFETPIGFIVAAYADVAVVPNA